MTSSEPLSTTTAQLPSTTTVQPPSTTTDDDSLIKLSTQFGVIWNLDFVFYCYAVLGPLAAFLLLCRFFILSERKHVQLSWQLKFNLVIWLISLVFGFVFYLTIWMRFVTPVNINSLNSELVRGSLHIASTNTLPLSTTFLLLDRICAISFLGQRLNKWRHYNQMLSAIAIFSMFFANLLALFYRTLMNPDNVSKSCTFSCRMNEAIKDLLMVKLVISVLNVVCGALFVYLYVRYSKNLTFKRERKFNHTTLFVFISEILCNILPTGIYLIWSPYIEWFRSTRFTSTMITVCHDTDGLVNALLYWLTRINSRSAIKKLIVSPLMKVQNSLSLAKKQKSSSTVKPQTESTKHVAK